MTIDLALLNPEFVADDRIDMTLSDSVPRPAALRPVLVEVDYSRCAPSGVSLPLILEVQGPGPQSYRRRVYRRRAPRLVLFTPAEGGDHVVVLREAAHNRWSGRLRFTVLGTTT